MSYKYYSITGIKEGWDSNGQVPIRRDFDEWSQSTDAKDKIQVILYLLALKRFQAVSPEKRDSYFQIAGIHGYPYTSWDEPSTTTDEVGRKGYCVHANVLFPSWHRPYMLLYEQRLYEIMVNEIIPEHPRYKTEYLDAARTWRLPFWDWAKNPKVPEIVRWKRIEITIGDDPSVIIDNPLYQFKMPNDKKMGVYGVGKLKFPDGDEFLEYGECYATSRCPDENERKPDNKAWIEGVVHDEKVDDFLTKYSSVTGFPYGTAAELVYRLLTYPMDYPHFATLARDENSSSATASTSSITNDINLEFIHNNVHYWVGGDGGHMSQIPVATFDPVFWLHHCNLDRLFAIWQTLNPGKWFETDNQRYFDQKIIGSGDVITNKTPLRPFHKDEMGTVWTPDDTRDWFKLGYTYPELKTGKETGAQLLEMVNKTYGITRQEGLQMTDVPKGMEIIDNEYGQDAGKGGVKMNDYALSIRYSKFALGGYPFNIEVFLRPEGETENKFRTEDFVTNVFNFSQPSEQDGKEVCSNCKEGEERDTQAIAYVPVTSYLIKMIQQHELSDLQPPTVEKVLARMYWRIVDLGGKTVPKEMWKDSMKLGISVSKTQMTYTNDPQVKPEFPDPEVIPSLGTSPSKPPTPTGVVSNNISVAKISQLEAEVPTGGSIVFQSPTMDLETPRRETGTGIALLHWDPSSTASSRDVENYDILLGMVIKNKRRVVQCNSKPAGGGYGVTVELEPDPWFGDSPQLRVDVEENQFVVYVDGRRIQAVERPIKNSITHVRYYTSPTTAQPVLARDIIATTYKNKNGVP
ncbi:tyrosinase [Daldinia decipiens]|uniref:tyrosinase n=1 Tax=Daldinia decipiens TaxID=326647 RepID=UPI0020C50021|nr:tyrosinase [Daldinia decipiens]KAI1662837.1 tyrosinase [Daldinia decipiens]